MFIKSSQKRYPNLCRYVEDAAARRSTTAEQVGAVSMMILCGLAIPVSIVLGFVLGNVLAGSLVLVAGLAAGLHGWKTLKTAAAKVDRLDVEAGEANRFLEEAIRRGRLHKVSGQSTTTLLEECARHWLRTRQALESPFWASPNLPLHYQGVLQQSVRAADRAMDEAVVLMRQEMALPQHEGLAEKIGMPEILEGVFGVKLAMPTESSLPLAYAPVRLLADRLRELADNVETLTLEVGRDPSVQGEFRAEAALDQCINELRTIRQAESELRHSTQEPDQELRQNLGG